METLNLQDLVAGMSPELQAQMKEIQAGKKGGGKSIAPLSDDERAHIQALVAACLLGHISQRDVVKLYKECAHSKTAPERKQHLRQLWFAPISDTRTGSNFEREFVKIYKELSGKDSEEETEVA